MAMHVPLQQIISRLRLTAHRRTATALRPMYRTMLRALPTPRVNPGFTPPHEIAARHKRLCGPHSSWLNVGGECVSLADPIPWNGHWLNKGTRLRKLHLHYLEYLEELAPERANEIVRAWMHANPPYANEYWMDAWNSYSISRRIVALFRLASRTPNPDAILALTATLAHFLERNIEWDVRGNHILQNARALTWAGYAFTGPIAERWKSIARDILVKELPHQILPDGLHFERSPSYHAEMLAICNEMLNLANGDAILTRLLEPTIAEMSAAYVQLIHPDGKVAMFSDAGLEMGPSLSPALVGQAGDGSFALPCAGYYGWRSKDDYAVIDAGPLAPADLPAHGHADIGSFEWSVGGRRVIVDQGVFEYNAGWARETSRATISHNTLCLDERNQATLWGAFRATDLPRVHVTQWDGSPNQARIEVEHDGYSDLPGKPIHRRSWRADASGIRIVDFVDGGRGQEARSSLLIHPEWKVERTGDGFHLHNGGTTIRATSSVGLEAESAEWFPDIGATVLSRRLRTRPFRAPGSCTIELTILSR